MSWLQPLETMLETERAKGVERLRALGVSESQILKIMAAAATMHAVQIAAIERDVLTFLVDNIKVH